MPRWFLPREGGSAVWSPGRLPRKARGSRWPTSTSMLRIAPPRRSKRRGGSALAIRWDLADVDSIEARVTTVERELGNVDIPVNINGGPPPTPASGQSLKLWSDSFRSMVLSVIAITDHDRLRRLTSSATAAYWSFDPSTGSGGLSPQIGVNSPSS